MKRRHHTGRGAGREGGRKGVEQSVAAAAAAAAAAAVRTGATALGKDLPSTFTLCRGIWEGIKAAVSPTKPTKATANELRIGAILFLLLLLLGAAAAPLSVLRRRRAGWTGDDDDCYASVRSRSPVGVSCGWGGVVCVCE